MLKSQAMIADRAESVDAMRQHLARIVRDLKKLPEAVRKVRASMTPPQDPVSLDRLLESRKRASRHAGRAHALLTAAGHRGTTHPGALAEVHELVEEVRAGLTSSRILDDVGEMLAEAQGEPSRRALRLLETRARRVGSEADHLFALAVATAQQDPPAGVQSMSTTPESILTNDTSQAVRELGEVLAATLAGSQPAPPTSAQSIGRRYPAVADQIAASLQAFGLPHDGVQLPQIASPDAVRAQLIDGLQRNFSSREEDGTRVYFRSAPQPVVRDAQLDSRLLRGRALVNANLLRAETDGVLAILDRLPDMLRFVVAQPVGLIEARARLRAMLDAIVATASDPLGINAQRGGFQFRRLSAAVLEVLRNGDVIGPDGIDPATSTQGIALTWAQLGTEKGFIADHLRARTSSVRNEEVVSEVAELGRLMASIHDRLTLRSSVTARGVAAGRLEELMVAADGAAAMLESELERFGTTSAEQGLQILAIGDSDVSLAQFLGWVRALAEPFVGVENAAAGLLPQEFVILNDELGQLRACADQFASRPGPIRFGGVRRQFEELKQFIELAMAEAAKLAKS